MTEAQAEKLFEKVRTLALALPEAKEVEAWGHPTFRAPKKMFAACVHSPFFLWFFQEKINTGPRSVQIYAVSR